MRRKTLRALTLIGALGLFAFGPQISARTVLPNQPAIAKKDASGTRLMVGWSKAPATTPDMKDRQTPDNPAFAGAELFHFTSREKKSDVAAINAFQKAGMAGARLKAKTRLLDAGIDILDDHPDAQGYAVMVEGTLDSQPAYGIALSIYGSLSGDDRTSGVHAFMAPKEKFKALGGFSIVVAQWFSASAKPGEDMSIEGSLSPQAATNRTALFFNKWMEVYVVPMMGLTMQMQLKSIEKMSSWNSAMTTCAGDSSCTVTQDSLGNWSANFE